MTFALACIGYFVLGLASAGVARYNQFTSPDEWAGMNRDDKALCVVLAAALWPLVWLGLMPFLWTMSLAERLGARKLEQRELIDAERKEVERAMRELQ
jgi:hypothetical protein